MLQEAFIPRGRTCDVNTDDHRLGRIQLYPLLTTSSWMRRPTSPSIWRCSGDTGRSAALMLNSSDTFSFVPCERLACRREAEHRREGGEGTWHAQEHRGGGVFGDAGGRAGGGGEEAPAGFGWLPLFNRNMVCYIENVNTNIPPPVVLPSLECTRSTPSPGSEYTRSTLSPSLEHNCCYPDISRHAPAGYSAVQLKIATR